MERLYVAFKKINDVLYYINNISKDGKITLIASDNVSSVKDIKYKWIKASMAKKDLEGKKYHVLSISKVQECLDKNISLL
jgi:hypothetical protein